MKQLPDTDILLMLFGLFFSYLSIDGVVFNMFILFSFLIISFFIILLLTAVSYLISDSVVLNREEQRSYECGFEHHNLSRVPFSLRYFFLTLIFLLFDLEIVLMVFLPYSVFSSNFYFVLIVVIFFVLVLFFGLIYE